jgi:hypothetical protein
VNPYVSFGLAMCAIVFLALFATSYMAVYFNRRAKADLLSALTPLALELNGQVEIDEATATGVYRGHLSSGKVTNVGRGPARVFETRLVDGAGGKPWKWTATWPKIGLDASAIETAFESGDPSLEPALAPASQELTAELLKAPGWLQFQYDPEAGNLMLTTPMRTRRDIPTQPVFHEWLESLYRLANVNRSAQARDSGPA